MAWVRIEDVVTEHPKHLRAGPAACWFWVCGIAYCQRQLSDGFIPEEALPLLGVPKGFRALVTSLVAVGLFERVQGGYCVHHYHDFNDTRAEALTKKDASREQHRQAGVASGRARRAERQTNGAVERPVERPVASPLNPIPSHPIPSRKAAATAPDARSKRPIYTSDRFVVFEWQLDDLGQVLGSNLDAFDLHAFFDRLSQQSRTQGLVIPKAEVWAWLQAQVLTEAKRRGLPIVGVILPGKPPGCHHDPPCVDPAAHTTLDMAERRRVS